MTATTISVIEGKPTAYPMPSDLSTAAAALDSDIIWQRIEGYIAWRFSPRTVEFIVEGPGDWAPTLKPVTLATAEEWRGENWVSTTLAPSPLGGYILKGCGPYRFSGTLGAGIEVPPIVDEAVRRLCEYFAALGFEGVGLRTETVPEIWSGEHDNRARARALQDSGAADLLRSYRRA